MKRDPKRLEDDLIVRPILDIGGPGLDLHALHDMAPDSVREGVLWAFLSSPSPFPPATSLYWELPDATERSHDILRRLLAVPLEARAAFRRLILNVAPAALHTLATDRALELRATGVRVASEVRGLGPLDSALLRIQPDYLAVGPGLALPDPEHPFDASGLKQILRQAWNLGAAVLANGVASPDVLDAARLLGIRFAEGPLFGPPLHIRGLADERSLARAVSERTAAARNPGGSREGV